MAEEVKLASSPLPSSSDLTQFDGQSDAITSSIDHAEIESIEPLTYRLNQFRMRGVGCDVRFIVGDEKETIMAHKLVLGASSAVFNAMFYGPLSRSNHFVPNKNAEFDSSQLKTAGVPFASSYDNFLTPALFNHEGNDSKQSICFGTTQQTSPVLDNHVENRHVEEITEQEEIEEEEEEEEEEKSAIFSGSSGSASFSSSPSESISSSYDRTKRDIHSFIKTSAASQTYISEDLNEMSNSSKLQKENSKFNAKPSLPRNISDFYTDGIETISIPDCSSFAFAIMIDYIYNNFDVNGVKLTDENVMYTLYTAKKYDISPLVNSCVAHLLRGLTASNAMCLLAQARLFQEDRLLKQCFQFIDKHTDIALHEHSVRDVDRDTLMEVLSRSKLDPSSELVIFNAAKSWAEAECARRCILPTVDNLRNCLGPVMKCIRFPLMNVNEFGHAASSSLLTFEEITEVFLYLTIKPAPICRYPCGFRSDSRSKHTVQRFSALSSKRCTRRENKICFTASRDVLISALGVYGLVKSHIVYSADEKPPNTWSYPVEIQLSSVVDPSIYGSSVCLIATNNVLLQGNFGDPTPYTAHFAEPIPCQAGITYVCSIRFISESGVQTFAGKDGQESISMDLPFGETVTFRFQSFRNSYGNDDGGKAEGQIPTIHFLIQWPEHNSKINSSNLSSA